VSPQVAGLCSFHVYDYFFYGVTTRTVTDEHFFNVYLAGCGELRWISVDIWYALEYWKDFEERHTVGALLKGYECFSPTSCRPVVPSGNMTVSCRSPSDQRRLNDQ